jgi:hypothetical protein
METNHVTVSFQRQCIKIFKVAVKRETRGDARRKREG